MQTLGRRLAQALKHWVVNDDSPLMSGASLQVGHLVDVSDQKYRSLSCFLVLEAQGHLAGCWVEEERSRPPAVGPLREDRSKEKDRGGALEKPLVCRVVMYAGVRSGPGPGNAERGCTPEEVSQQSKCDPRALVGRYCYTNVCLGKDGDGRTGSLIWAPMKGHALAKGVAYCDYWWMARL